jgi:hypothetical protein
VQGKSGVIPRAMICWRRVADDCTTFKEAMLWTSITACFNAVSGRYGEVVDVNLVRDKATGKSRGFAFLAYEDQRSTVLAVGKKHH